jgi:hypothetical protein
VVVTAVIIDCSFVSWRGEGGGGEIEEINQVLILR